MSYFDPSRDEELVPEIDGPFRGVDSYLDPKALETGYVSKLVNGEISRDGLIVTRRGVLQLAAAPAAGATPDYSGPGPVQNLAWFSTISQGTYLVGWIGGAVFRYDGAAWSQLSSRDPGVPPVTWRNAVAGGPGGPGGGEQIFSAQGVDKLYWTDGINPITVWDGKKLVVLGNQGDHTAPIVKYLVWHESGLVAAGQKIVPDAVYYSYTLDGTKWDRALRQIRVGAGDGDPIVALVPYNDSTLLVLKTRSVWSVHDDPANTPADYTIQSVHRSLGCVAPKSAVACGESGDIWFLGDRGVYSIRRVEAQLNTQEITDPVSLPIQDVINRITPWARSAACGVYYNNRYLLAVPLDGSHTNNAVLVYNFLTDTWSGYWTGWNPTCFVVPELGGKQRLWFGDANGGLYEWLDWVPDGAETESTYTDAGTPIQTQVVTRAYTFNEPRCPKTGFSGEIECNRSASPSLTVVPILDGVAKPTVTVTTPPAYAGTFLSVPAFATYSPRLSLPLVLPFTLPYDYVFRRSFDLQSFRTFRELQYQMTSPAGRLRLRQIHSLAWIESLIAQSTAGLGQYGTFSGVLQWTTTPVTVPETAGQVALSVGRFNGSAGPASVNWSTADGTAIAGRDYTTAGGTLTWGDGDTFSKAVNVPVLVTHAGATRSFSVNLSGPGGAGLGAVTQALVNVTSQAAGQLGYFVDPSKLVLGGTQAIRVVAQQSNTFDGQVNGSSAAKANQIIFAPAGASYDAWFALNINPSLYALTSFAPGTLLDVTSLIIGTSNVDYGASPGANVTLGISLVTLNPPASGYPNGSASESATSLLVTTQTSPAGSPAVVRQVSTLPAPTPILTALGSDGHSLPVIRGTTPPLGYWPFLYTPAAFFPAYQSSAVQGWVVQPTAQPYQYD